MGKYCQICAKGKMVGNNVSHSNRKSSRAWAPNVQKVRVVVEGHPMHINVCTRCLRSGYVQRALPAMKAAPVEVAVQE
ncbi:MAG: 50S ribosomal protein L28 [Clostridia bacterium]|nr:50S ribosomal protein L28 [Clostridia bacterium]